MKKLITIILAILFSGIFSSCKQEHVVTETAILHSFAGTERRDLGNAD